MSNLNLQKLREWVWPWPWTFNLLLHFSPTRPSTANQVSMEISVAAVL